MESDHASGIEPVVVDGAQSFRSYGKKVAIALPWFKQVSPVTSFCVAQLMDRRRTSSILNFGDAFVAHSRNTCVDLFLKSESEWMLTIDDDMIVPFGNATWYRAYTGFDFLTDEFASLNALDRLMSHGKSLVGALYFGRHPKGPPLYAEGMGNHKEREMAKRAPINLCKPVRWVGTGCMLIHRRVFEDIEVRFPRLARGPNGKGGNWFTSSEHTLVDWLIRIRDEMTNGPLDGAKAYRALELITAAINESDRVSSLGMGEDVAFCVRAAQAGHIPHVDLGLLCGHIGNCVFGPKNNYE